ncbi:MAG: ADP-ribosylglycohydrolase family protein [Phycisphaerales bacterium]
MRLCLCAFAALSIAGSCFAQSIDRADYEDRLQALWLGQCIANWTGLRTEGYRNEPPFLTDADWGTTPVGPPPGQFIDFVLTQNPWQADDDTDIEYVYLHLAAQRLALPQPALLGSAEIAAGWLAHMNPSWIWVSNRRAYDLMQRGVRPPMTGQPVANELAWMIDAQLTTEFFGALAPGMPDEALRLADLPIHTTATGYAVHASQFYVVLYSLAPLAPQSLPPRERALWLARQALKWIPASSKTADIARFVIDDFLANPDVNNWESTRDKIHLRYQANAGANGFQYRGWFESSVNFASGVMALLYGQLDYRRTVQIGTLSGWDSDNATATLGGMIGLMLGTQALRDQFPGVTLSDRFNIYRTRVNLPDYLPADPAAEDTFTLMAQRAMPIIDATVIHAGGTISGGDWVLPPRVVAQRWAINPLQRDAQRSANWRVRAEGGLVTAWASASPSVSVPPWVFGVSSPGVFANAFECDPAGTDLQDVRKYFFSTQGSGQPAGSVQTLQVTYDREVTVTAVRFIEGDHPAFPGITGGWFQSATVQLLIGGQWVAAAATPSVPLDPAVPFQMIDFTLAQPTQAHGVRIVGPAGGPDSFVTCAELDAIAPSLPAPARFDVRRSP